MLNWSQQFSILLFLDNNNYPSPYSGYECLLAAGVNTLCSNGGDALTDLYDLWRRQPDWIFGHLCYDYKNKLEPKLVSAHPTKIGFPGTSFFIPQTVCLVNREQTALTIQSFHDTDEIYEAILKSEFSATLPALPKLSFNSALRKKTTSILSGSCQHHIADGDCYEINFCNEGYSHGADIVPIDVFNALNALSPAPFAAHYRLHDKYMMCASPERYLRKNVNNVMSQPIKGTARRDQDDQKDEQIKVALAADIKERAENVMIVDLVRNDLARCCETGSVQVDELFGVYTFPQVHQLISTVSGTLKKGIPFTDAIRYSFPMGSMTGAPKYKVMQLVDQYENSSRELFSGKVGYISPAGDFDFNVIIRSLFYNASEKYLSYHTGGAITYDSDPVKEWEEMRLKAWALEKIFSG